MLKFIAKSLPIESLRHDLACASAALLWCGMLGIAVHSAQSQAQSQRETTEATYLTIQFLGEEDKGTSGIRNLPELVNQVKREFGTQAPGSFRHVGFSPGVLPLLNEPVPVLKALVEQALDLAEESGLPVLIHLDDMHFWYKRPDLFRDPEMVEWSAFPKPGTGHGPIVPSLFINWDLLTSYPTPPPCLECPRFRAEVRERLLRCIADPILARLKRWHTEGRAHLLAGVGIGNETQVPDYRGYALSKPSQEPELIDGSSKSQKKRRMLRSEMVRAGYAALHRRGYSYESVERLAKGQNKTVEDLTRELLYEVAHDYAEFRAKVLVDAGIPREKLYTHFTSAFRRFMESKERSTPDSVGTGGVADLPPPVRFAVNRYSRPGFTVSRNHLDLPDLIAQMQAANGAGIGDRNWGVMESYATTAQPGAAQTQAQYEEYLGSLTFHGAKVINLLGWTADLPPPEASFAIKRAPGVMLAIREWVRGKNLPVTWKRSGQQDLAGSVRSKVQQVQAGIRSWQSQGRDPTSIASLMQEFEPLMRQGKLEEAESVLDRALSLIGSK
jgi:hypothetical protein